MNWLIENSVLGLGVGLALGRKSCQKSYIRFTLVYPIFKKSCVDFSASVATSDPVLNDGSSNVALMAVKTKEELEEQAIAI